jgi:hypothetical protein
MTIAWLLFPILALVVFLGCGLLVERIAGMRLRGTILASVGLALAIVAATLTTYTSGTAKLTTGLVVALAVVGYVTSIGRVRGLRPEPFAVAVGLSLYAVFAAPIVLSGNATFLGYIQLNDTAIHFSLIDQLLAHGRNLGNLHASSYESLLHSYVSTDYPVGAQVALGALRPLVGQNVAWIFQPYLAVIASLAGVVLYDLLDGVVASRPLRAVSAFVAAQPGLVYALYLEASIKELATVWVIALVVVLVLAALKAELRLRRLAPLAITTVAAFDVLNVAIVPWLGVPLGAFAVIALWRSRDVISRASRRQLALVSGAAVVVLAALALPIIATAETSFDVVSSQLTKSGDLGNLISPLSKWQILGIWPSGDFRIPVNAYYYRIAHATAITDALIGLAVASALLGTAWALHRRAVAPLLLLAGSGLAAIYLLSRASPYASVKVMMIVSVAVVLMVMLGPAALRDLAQGGNAAGRIAGLAGWTLAIVVGAGVLWTNLEAYRGAKVAPRARFAELASIGDAFAGQGPAFYDLSDELAVHFLAPAAPTDTLFQAPQRRAGLPRSTAYFWTLEPWDLNELDPGYVQGFPLLVLARSPVTSRPPANYQLAYRDRFFEVWRRTATPHVLEQLPLDGGLYPTAIPRCATVLAMAKRAGREGARLAYATRDKLAVLVPNQELGPKRRRVTLSSQADGDVSSGEPTVQLRNQGVMTGVTQVPTAGRYELWLEGSISREVQVLIDHRLLGAVSYEIGPLGQFIPVGALNLSAGPHTVSIVVPAENLGPGERTRRQMLGPVVLAPAFDPDPAEYVAPADARSLCGRRLDWVEIVR